MARWTPSNESTETRDSEGALVRFPGAEGRTAANARFSAFLFVRIRAGADERKLLERLAGFEQICEAHLVDGEDCVVVKAVVGRPEALAHLRCRIRGCEGVLATRAMSILDTIKPESSSRQADPRRNPIPRGKHAVPEGGG